MAGKTKRLTRLVIDEVSAVDSGAGRGVRIALMKRNSEGDRWAGDWDSAFGLLPKKRRTTKQVDDDGAPDAVARAKAEIAANLREVDPRSVETLKHQLEDHTMPEVDIAKCVTARLAEMRKADPSIRSDAAALARLAESRDEGSQELWRAWKAAGAVEKVETINVEKAVRKMVARVSELEEGGLSRAAALLKIASEPAHHNTWMQWRATGANLDEVMKAAGGNQFSDGSYAFSELCRSLAASYPQLSSGQIKQLARQIQQHKPPLDALASRLGYRGAP